MKQIFVHVLFLFFYVQKNVENVRGKGLVVITLKDKAKFYLLILLKQFNKIMLNDCGIL